MFSCEKYSGALMAGPAQWMPDKGSALKAKVA